MSWLITARQHVQVPEGTDSECIDCTFLPEKRTHWSCRDCIRSTAGGLQTLRSSVTKLFLEEDVGLLSLVCNFKKNKKTNKNKKQLLLDLGMILKWDNLLMSLSTDSVRNKHLEKRLLLREIQQPTSAASSKNTRTENLFFF